MDHKFIFSPSVVFLPLFFVLSIWIVFWIEVTFHLNFSTYGVLPRTISGLIGIVCSPFIHYNIEHLVNNSIPLLLLLAALRFFYRNQAYKIIFFGVLLSGLITWLIGRQNYHIGASSLIYVLVSFMFFKGIQTKYYRLVALSFTIILLYGGMVWYIFPHPELTETVSISWEGHLAGFITGLLFAKIFKTEEYHKPFVYDWEQPDYVPAHDDFIHCFDDNGNFIDPVFEVVADEQIADLVDVSIVYEYKDVIK